MFSIDYLCLEDSIHTLCYGVVRGFVVLCHADPDAVSLQFVCIGIAAVLYAPIRVVDKMMQLIGRGLRDGHSESLERVLRLQCLRETPANDLVRVGVRHQMQIAAAVHEVDVRDVAHPQLIGARGYEAADEVLILVVAVVRVRRMARLRAFLHQLEVAQQLEERVTSGHPVALEHALHHQPQFVVADARVHLADLPDGIHDAHHAEDVLLVTLAILVVSLFRMAKQFTAVHDAEVGTVAQAFYCLAPDFFRILMPCSSAMSMSVFRARFLSWLYFSCFSSFSICLR